VLHLDPGVHLDEVELAVLVEELEGADAAVADLRQASAQRSPMSRSCFGDAGCRGLLDDLLVAALHGAVALAEMDRVAVVVGQHLELHVARVLQILLHVDGVVAEGGAGLGLGQRDGVEQRGIGVHHAHAAAAAAAGGLDDHRVADLAWPAPACACIVVVDAAVGAGHAGDAGLLHGLDGGDLVAHQRMVSGLGPMKTNPERSTRSAKSAFSDRKP
jgi:hypothetical protein